MIGNIIAVVAVLLIHRQYLPNSGVFSWSTTAVMIGNIKDVVPVLLFHRQYLPNSDVFS
jgi:hypothetical protein